MAEPAGFLGSTHSEVLDNPDLLIEIADRESAEARLAHMEESAAAGSYGPVIEMLAAPFRATVIRPLAEGCSRRCVAAVAETRGRP